MSEENIAEMRKTIERLSKDKAGLELQVKDQASQLRGFEAKEAFREQGYRPANGELFAKMNPEGEITAEAVVQFAEAQGFSPVAESTGSDDGDSQESTSKDEAGQADLASMSGGGSRSGSGSAGGTAPETLTRQAWQQLYAQDPAAAKAAVASGRVQISKDNTHSNVAAGPGNPFAAFTQES